MAGIERLSADNIAEALDFLALRPHDNVYVGWLVSGGRALREGEVALWRDAARRVVAACYYGPQIVPCGDEAEAIDALTLESKRARFARMIVGPRGSVERMWAQARAWLPRPGAIRTSQPVYALDRTTLRFGREDADVGRATPAELDEIVVNSAEMIAGEVGWDPRRTSADFRSRTARIIEAGWWWRYRVGGELAFMCNVGSAAFTTAQLQGVWTPPTLRGHGYATRAMGAICDRLLDEHASLCLYVNDFNTSAIQLYERVGFVRTSEFQTILFT